MDELNIHHRHFVALAGVVVTLVTAESAAFTSFPRNGADGFDFLHGKWLVQHRKLSTRLAGASDWIEFPGTLWVRKILGGLGNIDENVLDDPNGSYLASSLRTYSPSTGDWSIRWLDGRAAGIDTAVVGRFDGRLGRFYASDEFMGNPIRVRTTYENLVPARARWTQAFSADGGNTWEVNWTMEFTKAELPR